jgi:hypothetical protein
MAKTLINCPNCRKPISADVEQLFDINVDPNAKQRLLSGAFNQIQCPLCGFQGFYPSILVYHDPEKEILLTFAPPELNLPRNDQERITGSLINQVINNLPLEKRKGYLLNPQAALTVQGLVERILEADGITKEMIQAQQQRLNLLQRLLSVTGSESRAELAQQDDALVDASFFAILRRLIDAALLGGDQASAEELEKLQNDILPATTYGRELQAQAKEVEAAINDLQALGKDLTREKLLDLVVRAPSENYLRALVSVVRPAFDYQFFQLLSERIDRARPDGRERLTDYRAKLLAWTQEIDQQLETHVQEVRKLIDAIAQAENIPDAMGQALPYVDEIFIQELNRARQEARSRGDLERSAKLQQMVSVLQEASKPSEDLALIETLLEVPPDGHEKETWQQILAENADRVTSDFLSALASIAAQVNDSNDPQLATRIMEINRMAVRFSMERNLNQT